MATKTVVVKLDCSKVKVLFCEISDELLELVELEIRELLSKYEFPGDDIPIIQGAALAAMDTGGKDDEKCKCIDELMVAVDEYIPVPERAVDLPFLMPVEDVFSIKGRGTVVTGRVARGVIKPGDEVDIVGLQATEKAVVTSLEMFHKTLPDGQPGDAVGCLIRGKERDDILRGMVLAAKGSITPHKEAEAEVYVLTKEEGGRHTPFFTGYKPQFYIRVADITGSIELPEGVEMCMPGDNIKMKVKMIEPVAMDEGLRFAIREGGRTVGAGAITKLLD